MEYSFGGRTCEVPVEPIFDATDTPVRAVHTRHDVTGLLRAEVELRANAVRYQKLHPQAHRTLPTYRRKPTMPRGRIEGGHSPA